MRREHTEAFWRLIQEEGLKHAYTNNKGIYKFLRKGMAWAMNVLLVSRPLKRSQTYYDTLMEPG